MTPFFSGLYYAIKHHYGCAFVLIHARITCCRLQLWYPETAFGFGKALLQLQKMRPIDALKLWDGQRFQVTVFATAQIRHIQGLTLATVKKKYPDLGAKLEKLMVLL